MKRFHILLLLSAIFILAMPVGVWGASGAKLPEYETVVTRTVDTSEYGFSTSMTAYLSEAAEKASKTTQYKIVIPPGTYTARYWQNIPSNTWIYAKGARICAKKGNKRMVFLSNQKIGKATENILIEGGTWDTTTQSVNDSPGTAPFRFAHTKNLIFRDVIIKGNRKSHLIEVSDMDGLTITGCKISGNNYYLGVQPKEAIQLDVATKPAMVNMLPYNGKGCHNVLIENNEFDKVSRGVGSHNEKLSIVEANPYTNVTIRKNTFKNLKGEAVYIKWWKNSTVEKNTIQNGKRAGIFVDRSSKLKIGNNTIQKISAFTGGRRSNYGSETAGVMLRDSHNNSIQGNVLSQCKGPAVRQGNSCRGNSLKNNKKK